MLERDEKKRKKQKVREIKSKNQRLALSSCCIQLTPGSGRESCLMGGSETMQFQEEEKKERDVI